jgi:primosomal protein N'
LIADIVFDIPIDHAFSYVIPAGLSVARGQRVSAPLHGRSRIGVVVAVREGDTGGLKPLQRAVEPVPVLSDSALELTRWAAGESLSSWGSTLLSLLPPPPRAAAAETVSPPADPPAGPAHTPELWTDHRREGRLAECLERETGAALDGSRLLLLSATPSVESWWRAQDGQIARAEAPPGPWPQVITGDTRGILRNHPLTLPLTRAIEDSAKQGRRVALIVSRRASALACDDCGAILRCPDCGVPRALSRDRRELRCPLCARADAPPDRCADCGGHRLSPFGWDTERVQTSVVRRFPRLAVSRQSLEAQVVIGTPALLRALPTRSVGCVGFIALDSMLRVPDFRAGERTWELLWTAAEAVMPDGRVIVQTQHPEHYAVRTVQAQDRAAFYKEELRFRAELGYPPFRRLCEISARAREDTRAQALAAECVAALRGVAELTVYPPASASPTGARTRRWRFVVKGPADLPHRLAPALAPLLGKRRGAAGMVEVEMDPQANG